MMTQSYANNKNIRSTISQSMKTWKSLAQYNNIPGSAGSNEHQQKFSVRKAKLDGEASRTFHNMTLDKINLSGQASQQAIKNSNKSFAALLPSSSGQVRVLKASSSQMRLNPTTRERALHKRSTFLSASFMLNVPDENDDHMKNSQTSQASNVNRNNAIEQIKKLKREFRQFQKTVMKELQKQERLIHKMIEQIFEQVTQQKLSRLDYPKEVTSPKSAFFNLSLKQRQVPARQSQKLQKILAGGNNLKLSPQQETIPDKFKARNYNQPSRASDFQQQSDRLRNGQNKSFTRLFEAVTNLKQEIKEIGELSDYSYQSPRRSTAQWLSPTSNQGVKYFKAVK